MGGQVVRAQRGDRDRYQPISSSLCASADPQSVAAALLDLHPFTTLYIADLDAIRHCGNHLQTVAALRSTFPELHLWVDAGFSRADDCTPWQKLGGSCVIGSESQQDANSTAEIIRHLGHDRAILSLDSLHGQFKGPPTLLEQPANWPDRIIAMTLSRVGSQSGPDLELLRSLTKQNSDKKIYAAGGVRHKDDLHALADMGVAGALIASALHDGHITASDLARLR